MNTSADQFSRLMQDGVFAWNEWRRNHPDVRPDFRGRDFSKAELAGVDLSKAALLEANLNGASLYGANLNESNLYEATLVDANLCEASLNTANLQCADLSGGMLDLAELHGAYLAGAKLHRASLRNALLANADLSESAVTTLPGTILDDADLSGARLNNANLSGASLQRANLTSANLFWANLSRANLREAKLCRANLELAILVETDLANANLTECRIYGMSAWNVKLEGATQTDLVITPRDEPPIQVDNLDVAQFIYLLLNNERVRNVVDTITSKVVLILGRFTEDRKPVLDALRSELRNHNHTPIVFDFAQPASRNITETVSTLAHMARFVIADITDARSIPQELQRIVPDLPSLPIQPIILASQYEYGMFKDFLDYPWVLLPYRYAGPDELIAKLAENIVAPAIAKAKEIQARRRQIESELHK
jgi:uncharacterized protein YjbI with pentapeptide repeats